MLVDAYSNTKTGAKSNMIII